MSKLQKRCTKWLACWHTSEAWGEGAPRVVPVARIIMSASFVTLFGHERFSYYNYVRFFRSVFSPHTRFKNKNWSFTYVCHKPRASIFGDFHYQKHMFCSEWIQKLFKNELFWQFAEQNSCCLFLKNAQNGFQNEVSEIEILPLWSLYFVPSIDVGAEF